MAPTPPPASPIDPPVPERTGMSACPHDDGLPLDERLCPGDAMNAAHLLQLLRAALPDKSRHKAAGWFGQTDFLLTRDHVDEDQDAYHNALFITVWKRWDFWLALPQGDAAPAHGGTLGNTLNSAWARLRRAQPPLVDGLLRQYRGYDSLGLPGPWQTLPPLPNHQEPAEALQACLHAWREVIGYWRLAEGQRRAGHPLREQLHATLTPARLQALALLPVFTARFNDWGNPERNGWWEGDVWIGARQPGQRDGQRWGRALKFSWRNGREAPGDEEDDAHACYQIDEVAEAALPAPLAQSIPPALLDGAAQPPALRISYSQRQSDARVPLPHHAVRHMARLLSLFTRMETHLHEAHARDLLALQAGTAEHDALPPPQLPHKPPFAPHATDAEVLGPQVMALSLDWQALGRAHAARMREHWSLAQAEADDAPAQESTAMPPAAPPADPRSAQAITVLRLAQAVRALGDADLSARFHRRFAFAPQAFAHLAARQGRAVHRLQWRADGRLLAYVAAADAGQPAAWWTVSADGLGIALAAEADAETEAEPEVETETQSVMAHGLTVQGDAQGELRGMTEDGHALWRHHIGGSITAIAAAADGHTLAVGSAEGYLVLLRKGSGTDPYLVSTSRYAELQRFIFWRNTPEPLAW